MESLSIHELSHVVRVDDGDLVPDFLVNDIPDVLDENGDEGHYPDTLYTSKGGFIYNVGHVNTANISVEVVALNDTTYNVTLSWQPIAGWVYIRAIHPLSASSFYLRMLTNDYTSGNPNNNLNVNVWTTHRVIRTENEVKTQDYIHILDYENQGGVISTLFTDSLPAVNLKVVQVSGKYIYIYIYLYIYIYIFLLHHLIIAVIYRFRYRYIINFPNTIICCYTSLLSP